MIALRQMNPAHSAADELADIAATLRRIEDRLARAGLWEAHGKLVDARTDLASVGHDLERAARETFVALRQGKEVPK